MRQTRGITEIIKFHQIMRMTLKDLARFGILRDDTRLESSRVTGNKVLVLDFEMVRELDA